MFQLLILLHSARYGHRHVVASLIIPSPTASLRYLTFFRIKIFIPFLSPPFTRALPLTLEGRPSSRSFLSFLAP